MLPEAEAVRCIRRLFYGLCKNCGHDPSNKMNKSKSFRVTQTDRQVDRQAGWGHGNWKTRLEDHWSIIQHIFTSYSAYTSVNMQGWLISDNRTDCNEAGPGAKTWLEPSQKRIQMENIHRPTWKVFIHKLILHFHSINRHIYLSFNALIQLKDIFHTVLCTDVYWLQGHVHSVIFTVNVHKRNNATGRDFSSRSPN